MAVLLVAGDVLVHGAEPAAWLSVPIERSAVVSSNLVSVGYAARGKVLEIEFRSGAIYRYREVPQDVYAGLMGAVSKGQYFIRRIRGQFDFQRVTETPR